MSGHRWALRAAEAAQGLLQRRERRSRDPRVREEGKGGTPELPCEKVKQHQDRQNGKYKNIGHYLWTGYKKLKIGGIL